MPVVQSQQTERAAMIPMQPPVERVIQAMHAKLDEPFGLSSMAKIAYLSRFHFNRTFRRVTGIPPTRFLYAVRMATARRLLLQTQMRVIDICYEVGYNSLGTFTRRFTELLGVSPTRFRMMARSTKFSPVAPTALITTVRAITPTAVSSRLCGTIQAPAEFQGLILIGLFDSAIPQGKPRACTMVAEPGAFDIVNPPDGNYHLFALGLTGTAYASELSDCQPALRGGGQQISIHGDRIQGDPNLYLRPRSFTDPPILLTIPLLLQHLADNQANEAPPNRPQPTETGSFFGDDGKTGEEGKSE